MASEQNGSHALPQQSQSYGLADQNHATHSVNNTALGDTNGTSAPAPPTNGATSSSTEIPKDQVGWYFVEQYYTTLSKSPEKLFVSDPFPLPGYVGDFSDVSKLFYNKRSQFVSGKETEKCAVSVGQKAINDRIKELDFQDCKVRVTNVDSQGSGQNIIIQVIGEISNKSAPQRKFTQTFVLAEQVNGYFVLNDIFRYIIEEEEAEEETLDAVEAIASSQTEAASGHQETASAAEETVPGTLTSSDDPIAQEHDAAIVDKGLENAIKEDPATEEVTAAEVNGESLPEVAPVEESPAEVSATEPEPEHEAVIEEIKAKEIAEPEKPQDPEPTPLPSPPKAAAKPAASSATTPALPKTWANLVAGNKLAAAAVPNIPAVSPSPAVPKAAPAPTPAPAASAQQPAPSPAATIAPVVKSASTAVQDVEPVSGSEWQTAGHDHGKKQAKPQTSSAAIEGHRGYIKNVGESIDAGALRAHLSKIAEVTYFDVNRQKNCAFIDFSTPAGYQAAIAANPHEVSGERLYLEERRIRPAGNFQGNFNPGRGGARGGRGGPENRNGGPNRGGFQKDGGSGGRGNFPSRGGRGNAAARGGRGASQAAA